MTASQFDGSLMIMLMAMPTTIGNRHRRAGQICSASGSVITVLNPGWLLCSSIVPLCIATTADTILKPSPFPLELRLWSSR